MGKNNDPNSDRRGSSSWQPMIQRILKPDGEPECVTIRVRIMNGDAEHDFNAKFEPGPLLASLVCKAIAKKEGLNDQEASHFRLWIISKDLELQIRPQQDIFELIVNWNQWVMKYTHVPEAADPTHSVNRYWFVYRREAALALEKERKLKGDIALRLLYGEAKRNFLTRRYIVSNLEAATLAAMLLQASSGDYKPEKHVSGFLIEDDRYKRLLPSGMHAKQRPQQWEDMIKAEYKNLSGLSTLDAQTSFLEMVRSWPSYGCALFPVCSDLPPSGFFEHRTQKWLLGVNGTGIVVMDPDNYKYVHTFKFGEIAWIHGPDRICIQVQKENLTKDYDFISPQSPIINNVALRAQYLWSQKTGQRIPEYYYPAAKESNKNLKNLWASLELLADKRKQTKVDVARVSSPKVDERESRESLTHRNKSQYPSLERITTITSAFGIKSEEARRAEIIASLPVHYETQNQDGANAFILDKKR